MVQVTPQFDEQVLVAPLLLRGLSFFPGRGLFTGVHVFLPALYSSNPPNPHRLRQKEASALSTRGCAPKWPRKKERGPVASRLPIRSHQTGEATGGTMENIVAPKHRFPPARTQSHTQLVVMPKVATMTVERTFTFHSPSTQTQPTREPTLVRSAVPILMRMLVKCLSGYRLMRPARWVDESGRAPVVRVADVGMLCLCSVVGALHEARREQTFVRHTAETGTIGTTFFSRAFYKEQTMTQPDTTPNSAPCGVD